MPSPVAAPPNPSFPQRTLDGLQQHLNFFRIHIIFFTFTPLIFSAILYASNGQYPISYIDALFNSVSAMTVCGLATVNLSSLTGWQQAILFIQMCLGSPVLVAWVVVYIRRRMFRTRCENIVAAAARRDTLSALDTQVESPKTWRSRISTLLRRGSRLSDVEEKTDEEDTRKGGGNESRKLRPDMIRRMDDAPKLVNPSGWISEGRSDPMNAVAEDGSQPPAEPTRQLAFAEDPKRRSRDLSVSSTSSSSEPSATDEQESGGPSVPRTQTIEFAPPPRKSRLGSNDRSKIDHHSVMPDMIAVRAASLIVPLRFSLSLGTGPGAFGRSSSIGRTGTTHTYQSGPQRASDGDFGGFPWPHEIISSLIKRFFPGLKRQLTRTVTMPRTTTITSHHFHEPVSTLAKVVPYITFDAVVGRNSEFRSLTNEQLEELGGVEYRALTALLWIVGGYHILVQMLAFTIIGPYMSIARWQPALGPPDQIRVVPPGWFSIFQVVSAYTNTGMSLSDESMVPFQQAYPVILVMVFLVLAGNTAFVSHGPPDNGTDWFFFLVLDIGNPAIDSIPVGVRFIDGLLQAVAVRAAGFATVTLSALAPAVKVLYVIMMYISVYPIAMSVRSTNVYEEKSLGIYPEEDDSDDEDDFTPSGGRITVWSRYLAMHARKQLAFDMWWLGLALFLVCIIERGPLMNVNNQGWFTIFNVVFELVSAYGTVGLSLGLPYANYSFSGAFTPLSKLIVCAVMLRGRHRGLPVAIDRAVLLPIEYSQGADGEAPSSAGFDRRRPSLVSVPTMATGHNVVASTHEKAEETTDHRRRASRLISGNQGGEDGRQT
ncbi:potassium transporter [Heterobasidion irregulare TC 32-1]|uniref:Potassium transporter n=1 Tax=Heterobasidion irregulare (strain TC 32-1) TaxID=747525 RepID=W4JMT8_HETIT|nr:potassium transporter [Heterobasidion irregulare TC 32-1]ETW74843.1 potassium transporter [Heterobasidion irregulare TC 32-1]